MCMLLGSELCMKFVFGMTDQLSRIESTDKNVLAKLEAEECV